MRDDGVWGALMGSREDEVQMMSGRLKSPAIQMCLSGVMRETDA